MGSVKVREQNFPVLLFFCLFLQDGLKVIKSCLYDVGRHKAEKMLNLNEMSLRFKVMEEWSNFSKEKFEKRVFYEEERL